MTFSCKACGEKHQLPEGPQGSPRRCPSCGEEATSLAPEPPQFVSSDDVTISLVENESSRSRAFTEFLAPKERDDELGRLGTFRILEILGHGGMGVVFRGEDSRLLREAAVKVMLPALAASDSAGKRFLREAQAMAQVEHEHVVRVYQAKEDRGVPFLAMELLHGESLEVRLAREGKLSTAETVRIGREIAEGLAAAHATGLIHRDVKPANIWLEAPHGKVKLLDFGLARACASDAGVTQEGAVVGTPAYMSPEQARGEAVDHRADLFSLGAVLYRMCTGVQPFKSGDTISTLMAVATRNPKPPDAIEASVPASLSAFIMTLLAKSASERPEDARVVAGMLRTVHEGKAPTLAKSQSRKPHPTSQEQVHDPRRSIRRFPLFVAGAVFVAVACLILGWIVWMPRTEWAELSVESDDRETEVRVADGSATIVATAEKQQRIKVGKHDLHFVRKGVTTPLQGIEVAPKSVIRVVFDARSNQVEVRNGSARLGSAHVPMGPIFENCIGMKFAPIPKGTAWLGGSADQRIDVVASFHMGIHEVTQEQWQRVMKANPSEFSRTGEERGMVSDLPDEDLSLLPVDNVSWKDCQAFLIKLNAMCNETEWTYQLPTQAQWEYCCRGGPVSREDSLLSYYPGLPSDRLTPDDANITGDDKGGLGRTCKVGSYRPNRLGLFDMHGNVAEWCLDSSETALPDPYKSTTRAIRGGSWLNKAANCEATYVGDRKLLERASEFGLRLVRVPLGRPVIRGEGMLMPPPPFLSKEPGTAPKIAPKKSVVMTPELGSAAFVNSMGMRFASVPKGKSWLGGTGGTPGQRVVEIDKDFFLGIYEVTQDEWFQVVGSKPSYFRNAPSHTAKQAERFPVDSISWDDAQEFIKKLNEHCPEPGWRYRLPKETEWEYACRGGPLADPAESGFDFYFAKGSLQLSPTEANFGSAKAIGRSCMVGSYAPNRLGLYDMHGNIEEWCEDILPEKDGKPQRVVKGGHWINDASGCRAVHRWLHAPSFRYSRHGLRVARVAVE